MLDRFNKTNYKYYAKWDYIGSETSDIPSYEVLWELLENGEGPDVFLASALENEFDAIDKGYLEDLAPYETNGEVLDMIYEEAESYFSGERSLGDTCDAIQVRVQAYLDELE